MVKSSLYTRRGDQGHTGLISGENISKADHRIELYGEVDELNSLIGVVVCHLKKIKKLGEELDFLIEIQNSLFDLGSNLACEMSQRDKYQLPQISSEMIEKIEWRIDNIDTSLPKLTQFILPGGHSAACFLHLARTLCRRLERTMVRYQNENPQELPKNCLPLINRLSDYFFILARHCNHVEGHAEIHWKPTSKA